MKRGGLWFWFPGNFEIEVKSTKFDVAGKVRARRMEGTPERIFWCDEPHVASSPKRHTVGQPGDTVEKILLSEVRGSSGRLGEGGQRIALIDHYLWRVGRTRNGGKSVGGDLGG